SVCLGTTSVFSVVWRGRSISARERPAFPQAGRIAASRFAASLRSARMAGLVDGKWVDTLPAEEEVGKDGRFVRQDTQFRSVISPEPGAEFPAEPGRYHLWVAYVCPWASRTLVYRVLKGLEDVITVSYARPGLPKEGWTFDEGPDGPVEGGYPLHRLYCEHDARYTGKVSVPALWDKQTRRIVNNE